MRVHLTGQVTTGVAANGKRMVTLQVASGIRLADTVSPAGDTSLRIKWLLSIDQEGDPNVALVEYDATSRNDKEYFDKDLDKDKVFLHPIDSHGFVVDCVTDGNGSRPAGLGPRPCPARRIWRAEAPTAPALQVFATPNGYRLCPVVPTEKFPAPTGLQHRHGVSPAPAHRQGRRQRLRADERPSSRCAACVCRRSE